MKGKVIPHGINPIPKVIPQVILDYCQFLKSQGSLEITNPVTRILVTWTAQVALHTFSCSQKHSRITRAKMNRGRTGYHV